LVRSFIDPAAGIAHGKTSRRDQDHLAAGPGLKNRQIFNPVTSPGSACAIFPSASPGQTKDRDEQQGGSGFEHWNFDF
jgi:hypothetical protein